MQKRNKANLALGISAAGFLGTLTMGGFLGGLFHHGFLAAVIGGLADWFAVTALFHKPLGISYRTDILRRNRVRITDAIVRFTSEDLLSTKNVMDVLQAQDMAGLLVVYLEHRGGRAEVISVAREAMLRIVKDMDAERVAETLAPALRDGLKGLELEHVAQELFSLLAEEVHVRRILKIILIIAREVLDSPQMQQLLRDNIKTLRKAYEGEGFGRAFALSAVGIDDDEILRIFNQRAREELGQLLSGETEHYVRVKAGLEAMLMALARDRALKDALAVWKERWVDVVDLTGILVYWIEHSLKGENPFWLKNLEEYVERYIDTFCASKAMQASFDTKVKKFFQSELDKHHAMLTGLIRERLDEFSDDALVAFVESKVEDDLQMIRINGSAIGGLVGMGLFLLVTTAERTWIL